MRWFSRDGGAHRPAGAVCRVHPQDPPDTLRQTYRNFFGPRLDGHELAEADQIERYDERFISEHRNRLREW